MSIREDLLERAKDSTQVALARVGREPVVDLLSAFGAENVREVGFSLLASYIEEVEALSVTPPKVPVEFLIGDEVTFNYPCGSIRPTGVVVGYEVRYLVATPGRMSAPTFGHRAEKLKLRFNTVKPVEASVYFDFETRRGREK